MTSLLLERIRKSTYYREVTVWASGKLLVLLYPRRRDTLTFVFFCATIYWVVSAVELDVKRGPVQDNRRWCHEVCSLLSPFVAVTTPPFCGIQHKEHRSPQDEENVC